MQRRLSSAEKGKTIALEHVPAPRTARVRAEGPDISTLKQKHSLTLIGRVTNPSIQKVWSLIPFFTEHWKADIPPVGSDLGLGLFQFQFELESDLLTVLEKQPYHYARWMIILQRWEPTSSPDFPSMIPFWIKVQGIPIHLWDEKTIRSIGADIGTFETAEITSTSIRMRVHVNGRLPIIKKSVIEYDNGDEVVATLLYERLERHCSQCGKLDHELRDCLEAKALKKALLAAHEKNGDPGSQSSPCKERLQPSRTEHDNRGSQYHEPGSKYAQGTLVRQPHERNHSYGVSHSRHEPRGRSSRGRDPHRQEWKPKNPLVSYGQKHSSEGDERRDRNGSRTASDRLRGDSHLYHSSKGRYHHPRSSREEERRFSPQRRSFTPHEFSSASRNELQPSARGIPLPLCTTSTPHEAVETALGEIRETLTNYVICSDPTESAARRERLKQAELSGQIEKNAINNAKIARAREETAMEHGGRDEEDPKTRTPVSDRLGPRHRTSSPRSLNTEEETRDGQPPLERPHVKDRLGPLTLNLDFSPDGAPDRIPIANRLGPQPMGLETSAERLSLEVFPERTPATERLGPVTMETMATSPIVKKKKLGRPPGSKKAMTSAPPVLTEGSRKRKHHQDKPPTGRKKQNAEGEKPRRTVRQSKANGRNVRKGTPTGTPSSSDNVPIANDRRRA